MTNTLVYKRVNRNHNLLFARPILLILCHFELQIELYLEDSGQFIDFKLSPIRDLNLEKEFIDYYLYHKICSSESKN